MSARAAVGSCLVFLATACAAPRDAEPEEGAWTPLETGDDTPGEAPLAVDPAAPAASPASPGSRSPRTISLAEAVELARVQGLDLQIAEERALIARADADVARQEWYPRVQFGTNVLRHEGADMTNRGVFIDVDKQTAYAGASLRLAVDLADAVFGVAAARERAEAAEHAARAAGIDMVTNVAFHYFDLVEAYARVDIADEALDHASALVEFQQARVAGGSGLEADLAAARARHAAVRRAGVVAEADVRRISAALAALLVLEQGIVLAPDSSQPAEGAPLEVAGERRLEELLARAVFERPELAAADARIRAAAEDDRAAARRWFLPEVRVGVRSGGFGPDYNDLERQDIYTAGISWDLGAHLVGERQRASSLLRVAQLERERATNAVMAEVADALARLDAAEEGQRAAKDEVAAAETAHALARARNEGGAGLLVQVLQADFQRVRAQAALAAARAEVGRAGFALGRSIGVAAGAP